MAGRTHMIKRNTNSKDDEFFNLKSNLLSIFYKKNSKGNKKSEDKQGDMMKNHNPDLREDIGIQAGLTKEKAKEELAKSIEEKLQRVSMIELTEMQIDEKERERQRALAAERIQQRRKKRKEKDAHQEVIFTDQGVMSNYKASSVFDVIQPESFPFEEEKDYEPIEGQLSLNFNENSKNSENSPIGSSETDVLQSQDQDKQISLAMDLAIDKVFDFFKVTKKRGLEASRKIIATGLYIIQGTKQRILESRFACFIKDKVQAYCSPLLLKAQEKLRPLARAVINKEEHLSQIMCAFINRLDHMNDKGFDFLGLLSLRGMNKFNQIRGAAERNKKKLLIGFGASVAVAAGIMLFIGSMTAYEYIYNGKVLGAVRNQEDVYRTIDIIGDKLSFAYNAEITIDKDKDISFNKIYAMNQELDGKEEILNRLTYMKDMKARGYGIYVDNSLKAIMDSKASANEVLQEIKDLYIKDSDSIEYVKIGFAENVTIQEVETKLGNLKKKEDALEYMLTGSVEKQIHLVESGETFSEIAKAYGIKQSELASSNPDIIPEKLSIGQEVSLTKVVPVATVQTVEVASYTEAMPFEITYEDTGSMYEGETTVKSRGSNGQREVVAEITRNNGMQVDKKEISSKVISEPSSQVVLVGTKELPPLIGTGKFVYPVRGRLSSGYGTRWGRLHKGIDLAASSGTKIIAADGGKVVFSGYNGSLGYMIKIDHGGGRVSLYGHCSKLHVKAGERVYQGQHIANVGNTGRSTGPHLHFEVHINGKTKNPLNYL